MLKSSWEESLPKGYEEIHTHEFTKGESRAERQAWVNHQMENAQAAGIEVFCRETEEGYVFAFKEFEHHAAFYVNVYGDAPLHRSQVMHHEFPGNEVDPYWIKATEMYLQSMGIEYDMRQEGNVVSFSFDRFSEYAALRMMEEHGHIEHMARGLEKSDGFLGRLRQFLGGNLPRSDNAPGFDL